MHKYLLTLLFLSVCYSTSVSPKISQLHNLIKQGNTDEAIAAISHSTIGRLSDEKSMTAIHLAAYYGNERITSYILENFSSNLNVYVITPGEPNILLFFYL